MSNQRRDFFRKLFIGAAALPAVARVVMEERPVIEIGRTYSPHEFLDVVSRGMQEQICRHIATHDPYSGLIFAVDQHPIRFNA